VRHLSMRDGPRDTDDGDEQEDAAVEVDADVDSEKSSVASDDEDDWFEDVGQVDLESRPLSGAPARAMCRKTPSPRVVTSVASRGQTPVQMVAPDAVKDATTISWRDLPRKDQLIVLTLARLSEPLVQTSLQVPAVAALDHLSPMLILCQSYMFYMLKWFSPDSPDSVISSQAGILQYKPLSVFVFDTRPQDLTMRSPTVRASQLPSS
jgi:hypothetical protein